MGGECGANQSSTPGAIGAEGSCIVPSACTLGSMMAAGVGRLYCGTGGFGGERDAYHCSRPGTIRLEGLIEIRSTGGSAAAGTIGGGSVGGIGAWLP